MKNISTLSGLITIILSVVILFGGVFTYQYFLNSKLKVLSPEVNNNSRVTVPSVSNTSSKCLNSNGEDISDNLDIVGVEIEKQTTCDSAVRIADNCAIGASGDGYTTGIAYSICKKELDSSNPSAKLRSLLSAMEKTCDDTYSSMDGTMYLSLNDFCHLYAIQWVDSTLQGP
jgi:hypothetical protein